MERSDITSGLGVPPRREVRRIWIWLFFLLFLVVFSGWFLEEFWGDLGVLLGAILHQFSMFFSIEKCLGFWIDFGRPFGGFLAGPTLENEALVYTKRSFWQSHLFRSRGVFWCKMEPKRPPKWSQKAIKNRSKKWCIFSLKKVAIFDGKWAPGGAQRGPKTVTLGWRFGLPSPGPPKGVKWSQNDSKMEPKWT